MPGAPAAAVPARAWLTALALPLGAAAVLVSGLLLG
jgi:cobalt/nickel transport system permease protein